MNNIFYLVVFLSFINSACNTSTKKDIAKTNQVYTLKAETEPTVIINDCFNCLPNLRDNLIRFGTNDERVAFQTLENMYFNECGKEFLINALYNKDQTISKSAFEIIMLFAYECWRQANENSRPVIYNDFKPYNLKPIIEKFSQSINDSKYKEYVIFGLSKLKKYSDCLKEIERYQSYNKSLPSLVKKEINLKAIEILSEPINQTTLLALTILFDDIRIKYPKLTEEQLFEVASILGNKISLNAMYFMFYKNGLPDKGGINEDPCYDYKDVRINLPD